MSGLPPRARDRAAAWRLLVDPAADGAWNLALDEALLDSQAESPSPAAPTLRLYSWTPAALSLGCRQPSAGAHDPDYLRARGIDLVRRPTGGGAVLHEHERTYAVVGRLREEPFPGGVLDTFARVAAALVAALGRLGLDVRAERGVERRSGAGRSGPSCFAVLSAHEISSRGRKLVGSAQLRRGAAFLQHGSILLRADAAHVARALGERADAAREAPFTDLERELGRAVDPAQLDQVIVEAFAGTLGADLRPGAPTSEEVERASRLRAEKYLADDWTLAGVAR